ncbi:MAG: DUF6159 family protein, partial [Candidatus Saccharimonadales bacterium]
RVRFVGWILAWLLGALWSLGTLFVIPIIMTSQKPSGVSSIKSSFSFFKRTWGESIVAKLSVNTPLALLNVALIIAFITGIVASVNLQSYAMLWVIIILYIIISIILSVIGSFANSLVNIALFYYATYGKVPPAFSEDLLNQVFIKKKRRHLFGSKGPSVAT